MSFTRIVQRRVKGFNLTPYVSPLLLRLHPDTVQRRSPALAQENEQALKQLNVFLELATFGCNNDAFNARKQVLALSDSRQAITAEEPVRFPLVFHVPTDEMDGFVAVEYTVEVPGRLVKRTLANPGRSVSVKSDPEAALQAPFAREWQRITKRILQDLFQVAQVPLVVEGQETKRTALAEWLDEEETVADQADRHGVRVGEQNRAKKKQLEQFDKVFHQMLTRERNLVHETTTGLEDGPTSQHAVLTSLLHSRLFLPKFEDPHMKKSAFHWIANFLLLNFMELRLHSLVWNKVTVLLTADAQVKEPQALWNEQVPEEGMGILIPIGMDIDTLIDFIYENVEELEFALEETNNRAHSTVKEQQVRREKKKKGRRRGHFYQQEVDAIFRK